MRNSDFRRETRINRSAAGAGTIEIGTGVIGIDDVLGLDTEAFKVAVKQRGVGVNVQDARNADAQLGTIAHASDSFLGGLGPSSRRDRIGNIFRVRGPKDFLGGEIHEIRMFLPYLVKPRLNILHFVEIFDSALFASGDNQALFAHHQRNLRHALYRDEILGRLGAHVNESAQAIVLAKIASSGFVAGSAVFDFPDRIESDERGPPAVAPQPQRFLRRTNGAGFAAVLMHDNFRLFPSGTETIPDEIDFGLHDGEIILRAALQNEPRAQRSKIGDTRDVQKH